MSESENAGTGVPDEQTAEQALLEANADLIAKFREKFDGEIIIYAAPPKFGGVIVAAVPESPKVTQAFINAVNDPKVDNALAQENYALASVVHPDRDTTKLIFKRKPFLAAKIATRVSQLAGGDAEELGKD
jgi:hypothetical protein